MLYIPWRDETPDLLGGFRSHYEDKIEDLLENEWKYTHNATEIDEANDDLTEHAWSTAACMGSSSTWSS